MYDKATEPWSAEALLTAPVISLVSPASGVVAEVSRLGALVHAGDAILRLQADADPTLVSAAHLSAFAATVDSESIVTAPADGRVWNMAVRSGSSVPAGEAIIELLDCSQAAAMANVSAHDAARLPVGARARFIPHSGDDERAGTVVRLLGGGAEGGPDLALRPERREDTAWQVVVLLDPVASADDGCEIGAFGRLVPDARPAAVPPAGSDDIPAHGRDNQSHELLAQLTSGPRG
ncbi:MAG: HlyD family efflux transporter periplasmic adaptor subunit [Rhodocyclaceae bacterium]|nr:HlyD family efflux transporter periplasmic adaptor subunit [Rhodocyclaceae bacterium]